MPTFTTRIKDTSPILRYSPNWRAGTSATDQMLDQYTESSFTATQTPGATMSLTFNGTGVSIVGAMRSNHGPYSVNIDGISTQSNGASNDPLFNQTLFSSNALGEGEHTLTLSNQQAAFLDIDYVVVATKIGDESDNLIVNTYQDNHPSIVYSPLSQWYTPGFISSFSGSSGHATQSTTALMTMHFEGMILSVTVKDLAIIQPLLIGHGIAVYGPVGPNQTQSYLVQVDGNSIQQASSLSAQKELYKSQQLLFFSSNLGSGSHTLTMRQGGSGELAIDYVNIYSTSSLGGQFSASSPNTCRNTVPEGILAALAILSVIALGGMLGFIYFFWRHLQISRERMLRVPIIKAPDLPDLDVTPFPQDQVINRTQGEHHMGYHQNTSTSGHHRSPSLADWASGASHEDNNLSRVSESQIELVSPSNPPEYYEEVRRNEISYPPRGHVSEKRNPLFLNQ